MSAPELPATEVDELRAENERLDREVERYKVKLVDERVAATRNLDGLRQEVAAGLVEQERLTSTNTALAEHWGNDAMMEAIREAVVAELEQLAYELLNRDNPLTVDNVRDRIAYIKANGIEPTDPSPVTSTESSNGPLTDLTGEVNANDDWLVRWKHLPAWKGSGSEPEPEPEPVETTHLHSTTDPIVWAEAFFAVRQERLARDGVDIADDEGCLLTWFANAFMAQHDKQSEPEPAVWAVGDLCIDGYGEAWERMDNYPPCWRRVGNNLPVVFCFHADMVQPLRKAKVVEAEQ